MKKQIDANPQHGYDNYDSNNIMFLVQMGKLTCIEVKTFSVSDDKQKASAKHHLEALIGLIPIGAPCVRTQATQISSQQTEEKVET